MKNLFFLLTLLSSNCSFAESLGKYLNTQLDEVCSSGETITIHDLNSALNQFAPSETNQEGCSLYSSTIYNSISEAGLSSNDGYGNRLLSVKMIGNSKALIYSDSLTIRDIPLCIKKYGEGSFTVGYQITSELMDTYPGKIYGNKIHNRRSIIQVTDNKISWAGQAVSNSERSMFLFNRGFSNDSFRCGQPR